MTAGPQVARPSGRPPPDRCPGRLIVVTGVVTILAWGIGANPGDAAFSLSSSSDTVQIPVIRIPGGATAPSCSAR